MAMELWVPVVEETLPRRISFLRVFGDDDGDSFGVGFGEDFVRCFCFLCFGSGGRGELSGVAVICSGVSSISGDGGMRVVWLVLFALGMELVLALWGLLFRVRSRVSGCGVVLGFDCLGVFVEGFVVGKTPLQRQPLQTNADSLLSLKLDDDGRCAPEGGCLAATKSWRSRWVSWWSFHAGQCFFAPSPADPVKMHCLESVTEDPRMFSLNLISFRVLCVTLCTWRLCVVECVVFLFFSRVLSVKDLV